MWYKRNCKRCGTEHQFKDYHKTHMNFCEKCLPTKEQLYQWYTKELKTKREILDLINANYTVKVSFTTIKRIFTKYGLKCKDKKPENIKRWVKIAKEKIQKRYENKSADELIKCKICGEDRICLVTHVTRVHNISTADYKRIYETDTVSKKYHELMSKNASEGMKAAWHEGRIKRDTFHFGHRDINADEIIVQSLSKNIAYVGGMRKGYKSFWIKTSKQLRNPDFVVIKDEAYVKTLKNFKNWYEIQDKVSNDFTNHNLNIEKVVEFAGYYWHQQRFRGRTKEEYEKDIIQEYKDSGKDCLMIWDYELKNLQLVKTKIEEFVKV